MPDIAKVFLAVVLLTEQKGCLAAAKENYMYITKQ